MVENDRLYSGKELSHNIWLKWKGFGVYFRWCRCREIADTKVLSLELANIGIPKPLRGRSWFRTFIALLKKISPTDAIIIEEDSNALNPWMGKTLKSWGFWELSEETYWFELRLATANKINHPR